ncbi:G/U mismatch-specific DNA glycosylase [Phormidesmis sp. 146-33]
MHKPTKDEIRAAIGKTVPDIIAPDLQILFCGINPSLYSVVVGHHFARPGNRFWKALHLAGFTDRILSPSEDQDLLNLGLGITNIVDRATARADELDPSELLLGHQNLAKKIQTYRPKCLAVLGISAYRTAFSQPKSKIGRQENGFESTIVWVLPNPSGLNAHYQIDGLAQVYRELWFAIREAGL